MRDDAGTEDAVNTDTRQFEALQEFEGKMRRANGRPVPPNWPRFSDGEIVVIKGWEFAIAGAEGKTLTIESVGPRRIMTQAEGRRKAKDWRKGSARKPA